MTNAALLEKAHTHEHSDYSVDDLTDGLFVVASAPAGWYDIDENTRRWFDGRGWTDHYAPILKLVPDLDPVPLHLSTNHGFHAIMVIMTLGVWVPIWLTVGTCNVIRSLERSRSVTARG